MKKIKTALIAVFSGKRQWPEDLFAHLEMLIPNKCGISASDTEWVDFYEGEEEEGFDRLKKIIESAKFGILVIEKRVKDFVEKSPLGNQIVSELCNIKKSFTIESKDDFGKLEEFLRTV